MEAGMVGDELSLAIPGDGRRQRVARFAASRASPDAWLDQQEEGFEAHLLDPTLGSGKA
jgi:hypothetical protein